MLKLRLYIPALIALITGKKRYILPMEWSKKSMIFNVFRLWEQVFGVEEGIKHQCAVFADKDSGVVIRTFNTIESALIFAEAMLVHALSYRPKLVKVHVPQFAAAGPAFSPVSNFPYLFAIAFDNSKYDEVTPNNSSFTTSFTVGAGSNRGLITGLGFSGGNSISSFTYNSVAGTIQGGTGTQNIKRWVSYLPNPSSGANNATMTATGSANLSMCLVSYSGAQSTTTFHQLGTSEADGVSQYTINQTTTVNDCWQLWYGYMGNTGTITYPSGFTQRSDSFCRDTNGSVGNAGAYNRTWEFSSGSGYASMNLVAFSPFTAVGPTNVKTWNGVTLATGVKTVDGLAIASVKTINGLN